MNPPSNSFTLGLSFGFHDSTAALVRKGEVILTCSEEKFTGIKHDSAFPTFAIEHCFKETGISSTDLAEVIYYENPFDSFTRVVTCGLAGFPHSAQEFIWGMKTWFGGKLWVKNEISKQLNMNPNSIVFLNHHQSHQAQAFIGSGFEESAILIVDAVGEWTSSSLSKGSWIKQRPIFENSKSVPFPHSLGLLYSTFTAFLGFTPMDGECNTMALAAFGEPRYADSIRNIITLLPDGSFRIDSNYLRFERFFRAPWTSKFIQLFGEPRHRSDSLPFDALSDCHSAPEHKKRWADIAASIQQVLEEVLLHMARSLRKTTQSSNLCYAGGVALNCVANSRLLKESGFDQIYIPPDPGDGGAAVGAALFGNTMSSERPRAKFSPVFVPFSTSPFLNSSYDELNEEMLKNIDPRKLRRFVKHGYEPHQDAWEYKKVEDLETLVDKVAQNLANGKIVAWCQGYAENGPRALGNRSLLIRPDDLSLARRLSNHVKSRAFFRPYSLSISEDQSKEILDMTEKLPIMYRWMQVTCSIKPKHYPKLRAALHVDGTTRPQVCRKEDNPKFYKLLKAMNRYIGIEALLNTSFNEAGYPLIRDSTEALISFARTDIDVLVFNQTIIKKQKNIR